MRVHTSVNAYTKLKNEINENGYFKVGNAAQFSKTVNTKEGGANPVQTFNATINLLVTEETQAAAAEEAQKAAATESAAEDTSTQTQTPAS